MALVSEHPTAVAENQTKENGKVDVAGPARTFIRFVLTVGAAALYATLVFKVSLDVWNEKRLRKSTTFSEA